MDEQNRAQAAAPRASGASEQAEGAADVIRDGIIAGGLGAAVIALFFLVVDTLGGQPLYTPSLLGSVLFLGADAESVTGVNMPMVAAYTAVHMLVFMAAGIALEFGVSRFASSPGFGIVLLILFVCFETGFLGAAAALMPDVIGQLGAGLVILANLLAAAAMGAYVVWWRHPDALRSLDRAWEQ